MVHSDNLFCDFLLLCNYEVFKREACFVPRLLFHMQVQIMQFFWIKIHYGHLWVCANVGLSCSSPFCIFWLNFFPAHIHTSKWMKHSLSLACEGQIMSLRCTGWMDWLPLCASISSKAKHSQACQCVLIQYSNVSWPYISTSVTHMHTVYGNDTTWELAFSTVQYLPQNPTPPLWLFIEKLKWCVRLCIGKWLCCK